MPTRTDRPAPIAYFSMEIAVDEAMPTYSGGLGVLAGDHLRAAADLGLPLLGVTLVYHHGFFRQTLAADGTQRESPARWSPAQRLEPLDQRVTVEVGGRPVTVGAWRHRITGVGGHQVEVYFLDTRLPENDPEAQAITDRLYADGPTLRLAQEAVLGLGGTAMVAALGHEPATFHLNEGHAALAPVGLLALHAGARGGLDAAGATDLDGVRDRCVFTTHTPVPAGHDRFSLQICADVLGPALTGELERLGCLERGQLNMTNLGMFFSGFINGVAQRHAAVSQAMFPRYTVRAVTNGVHVRTWAAPSSQRLFDRYSPRWREDNAVLRYLSTAPLAEVRAAHDEAKRELLDEVARRSGRTLDPEVFTIGVARRAAAYKRNDLLLSDLTELRRLVRRAGPVQVLYSGKSHPRDAAGKEVVARVTAAARKLGDTVPVVYLEDYDMALGALLCAGVDLWLNTPVAPHEASGTSGMKAAVNGVPSLSVLDGWWIEGHIEGVTGWAIGDDPGARAVAGDLDGADDGADAAEMYRVLREDVVPLFYGDPDGYAAVGRGAMALNGSFFTTQRMVSEYAEWAYGAVPVLRTT